MRLAPVRPNLEEIVFLFSLLEKARITTRNYSRKTMRNISPPDVLDVLDAIAAVIPHTACVFATGDRDGNGIVELDQYYATPILGERFVNDYVDIAGDDVVAQQFSCFPDYPLIRRTKEYQGGGKTGRLVKKALQGKIDELLITGLDSNSYGLIWVTLYRLPSDDRLIYKPFTTQDAEKARYIIPSLLYAWQQSNLTSKIDLDVLAAPETANNDRVSIRYKVLELSPRDMMVAFRLARGYPYSRIAEELKLTKDTSVSGYADRIRSALNCNEDKIMDRIIGPLPTPYRKPI